MVREITLFDMVTMQPNLCIRRAVNKGALCADCRWLVTIRNDNGHRFRYCGITECAGSIIGCKPVRPGRRACNRFSPGKGEMLQANNVFTPLNHSTP